MNTGNKSISMDFGEKKWILVYLLTLCVPWVFGKMASSSKKKMKLMQSLICHNFLNIGPNELKLRPFDFKFNVDVENVVKSLKQFW